MQAIAFFFVKFSLRLHFFFFADDSYFQKISWPEIGIEFVKRAIETKNIENVVHNGAAIQVQKAFEEHGSPRSVDAVISKVILMLKVIRQYSSYSYQVLVVPSSEVDTFWSVGSTSMGDYTNITDFHGLDIHVFRFNKTDVASRAEKAQKWMNKNKDAISIEIR